MGITEWKDVETINKYINKYTWSHNFRGSDSDQSLEKLC